MPGITFDINAYTCGWVGILIILLIGTIMACYWLHPSLLVTVFNNYSGVVKRTFSTSIDDGPYIITLNVFYYIVIGLATYLFFRQAGDIEMHFVQLLYVIVLLIAIAMVRAGFGWIILYTFSLNPSFSLFKKHHFYHTTVLAIVVFPLLFSTYFFGVKEWMVTCFIVMMGLHFVSLTTTMLRSFKTTLLNWCGIVIYILTFELLPFFALGAYIRFILF